MRKVLFPLLFSLLLFTSCASYTIAEARETIVYPESGTTETRIRVINEQKEAEKAERQRIEDEKEAERLRKAEAERVNTYPEDLTSMTFPFYYNPVKNSRATLTDTDTEFSAVIIPLGEEDLTDEELASVVSFLSSYSFTLTALTGKLSSQTAVATALGKDAVTLEGGTVIFDGVVLEKMNEDYMVLKVSPERSITVYSEDFHPVVPHSDTVEDVLTLVDTLERQNAEELIEKVSSPITDAKILFLTSIAPSSLDWTAWTDYSYREERSFLISDMLSSLRWNDAYAVSRYSEETEPGVTRFYGTYAERLDFIYSKGMITLSSLTVPVENLSSSATVASFLIP